MKEITCTNIWQLYQKGIDYINQINLVGKTDKCHRMYNGDQWHGVKSGGEDLPMLNFIKGIVKYKVATVAQNTMSAVYNPIGEHNEMAIKACEALNRHFQVMWERAKMDKNSWNVIKDACIGADSYIYFGGADVSKGQILDNVNVLLSDEQNPNIQEQKYILIVERLFVSDVREEAKRNGISKDDIDLIVADTKTENQLGNKQEVNYAQDDGKCTSILYMYKGEDGFIHFAKSTSAVVYKPDEKIVVKLNEEETGQGLTYYPIVNFIWDDKKGSARGCGEVEYLIPNQIELNKTLARRAIAIKQCAYPKVAYMENAISDPSQIDTIGAKIGVKDMNANNIQNLITYLNPTSVSPDAKNFTDELIVSTKELAGAGDAATGAVDPTQASGTAIIASRDQAALPLNEQVARYRQFVEDIAVLWYEIWKAYNPNGLNVETQDENGKDVVEMIPSEILDELMINVRIDVSQNNPFSKFAQEQAILNLFTTGAITFEEMIDVLDDDAVTPKGKLKDIVDKRQEMEENKTKAALAQALEQLKQYQQMMQGGGMNNEMQGVPN